MSADRKDAPAAAGRLAPDAFELPAEDSRGPYVPGRYSPARMFAERVRAFWTSVWRSWRTVLDWTVLLYIVLPGAFISVGMYRDFMRDPPPDMANWPLFPVLALLALLQLTGKYRTFAERGDGLFLHRLTGWRRKIAGMGFAYGLIVRVLATALTVAVLSPVLVPVFGLTAGYLLAMIFYYASAGACWLLAKDLLSHRWRGWRKAAVLAAAGIAFFFAVLSLATRSEADAARTAAFGAGMAAASIGLLCLRLRSKGTLLREIAVESEAYIAFVGWALMDALEKKPIPRRRKPLLFSRSQPLIRHRNEESDRLADIWAKSALRREDAGRQLLSFAGVGTAAISLCPPILGAIVWLVIPLLLMASLNRLWSQWLKEPFIALFHWSEEALRQASLKATSRMALPIVSLWALALGIKFGLAYGGYVWAVAVAAPVAGYFWTKIAAELMSSVAASRRNRDRRE